MTFFRVLAKDRLLAVCFLLLALAGLSPLSMTSMLPFIDLNLTAGHGAMLFDVGDADHPVAAFYFIRWVPVPYWTSFVLTALADATGGTVFAAKALVGLLVVLLPASVIRLLVALRRDPRLGLWAFMLNWERNLWAGWTAYLLGMALALIALAWLIETDSHKRALKVTAMAMVVALTHVQALAFLAVAGALITFSRKPTLRRLWLHALALSGGLLAAGPWLYDLQQSSAGGAGGIMKSLSFEMHTPGERITKLFEHTFDTFAGDFVTNISALTFWCLCLGSLIITALGRRLRKAPLAPALAVMVASLALYMLLPFAINGAIGHKHNYVRYGSFILLGTLLIPRTRLRGRYALALLPGIACALAMDVHMARHLKLFHENTRAFTEMFGVMEPGSRLLPLVYKRKDPTCKMPPMGGFHGILAGRDRLFEPHFFRTKHVPIQYRPGLPRPLRAPSHQNVSKYHFRKRMHGYDYVLIQGIERDPFAHKKTRHYVTAIKQAGIWKLYRINQEMLRKSIRQGDALKPSRQPPIRRAPSQRGLTPLAPVPRRLRPAPSAAPQP